MEELSNLLRDNGFESIAAPSRLAEFYSVTNTYLSIFLALGILALALGTIGLAIVVARSILERKQELAILMAVGFTGSKVVRLILHEYLLLLVTGVCIGFISAFVAVMPVFVNGNTPVSAVTVTLFIALIIVNGFAWILFLSWKMVKPHHLLSALREQ